MRDMLYKFRQKKINFEDSLRKWKKDAEIYRNKWFKEGSDRIDKIIKLGMMRKYSSIISKLYVEKIAEHKKYVISNKAVIKKLYQR